VNAKSKARAAALCVPLALAAIAAGAAVHPGAAEAARDRDRVNGDFELPHGGSVNWRWSVSERARSGDRLRVCSRPATRLLADGADPVWSADERCRGKRTFRRGLVNQHGGMHTGEFGEWEGPWTEYLVVGVITGPKLSRPRIELARGEDAGPPVIGLPGKPLADGPLHRLRSTRRRHGGPRLRLWWEAGYATYDGRPGVAKVTARKRKPGGGKKRVVVCRASDCGG
jgi:hypothetical protein